MPKDSGYEGLLFVYIRILGGGGCKQAGKGLVLVNEDLEFCAAFLLFWGILGSRGILPRALPVCSDSR